MAQVNLPNVDGITTLDQVKNALGRVNKELTWLLQNLDTRNINELNAEVIIAGSIQTDKLAAGAITAEKIDVDELSAISADLGTITAGLIQSIQIFGSYIATRNGEYPRAEMSNTEHLFAAFTDSDNHVKIRPDLSGAPGVRFTSAGSVLGSLNTYQGFLEIWGPAILALTAPKVQFGDWYKLFNMQDSTTLGEELDNIWEAINSKADIVHVHSVTIPDHNHGNPDNVTSGGGTFTVS